MSTFYEFSKKMMRITGCTREEDIVRMVQMSFQKVTELPSLITDQRENCRVLRKNWYRFDFGALEQIMF